MFGTAVGEAGPAWGASDCACCDACGSKPLPIGNLGTPAGPPAAGGVKGAPGAGAGCDAEAGPCAGLCAEKAEAPPDGLACGGGVNPGSGGTGPFGIPEPPGAPEPPGPPAAPEGLDSSDAPVPCPEDEFPEAFCVYQAGGA